MSTFIKASFWSSMSEIVAKVIGPLSFIFLTRLLSPSDFGVVAVATTIMSFIYIISDLGTSKIIIQTDSSNSEYFGKTCNVAFLINIFIGVLCFIIVFSFSENLAELYGNKESGSVIRALSLQIIFSSLSSVQNALRKKNLDFKFLFVIRFITVASPVVISIPIAFCGGGYWAIVTGNVVGAFFSMIALWITSDWKPTFYFNFSILNSIFAKSFWETVTQIFIWIPVTTDTYLISHYLDSYKLGMYTTTRSLFTFTSSLVLAPIMPVIYSSLCATKDNLQFKNRTIEMQNFVFMLTVLIIGGIVTFSYEIEYIVFTDKWKGISSLITVVFLLWGFEYFYSILLEALKAKGLFRQIGINTMFCTILTLPILYFSVQNGLVFYVICRGICLYMLYPRVFFLSKKYIDISFRTCFVNNLFVITVASFFLLFDYFVLNSIEIICLKLLLKITLYLLMVVLIVLYNKTFLIRIYEIMMKMKRFDTLRILLKSWYIYIYSFKNMLKWKIEALLVRSRNLNLKELDASDFHSLIFIPHADDELVGCYSLIKDAGSVSGVYFAFLGDDYSEENKEKRSTELKKFALSRNLQLFGVPSNNEELINIINKKKINSIFLPCLIDWHPEHIKVSDYLYHFLKETRSLEIILNCSIYMYQVSVPLPDLLFNSYIGLSNCEQRKKWSEFCEFYSSQKHLPTYRFGIQECVSARNTEYYSVESFVEMTISEWLLFYETFKEKYIESDFTAMKSNISNIREIRKMSNNLYMKIYGKRY